MAIYKFFSLFLLFPFLLTAQNRRFYVDADAQPGGTGLSWATAYTDLQEALRHAIAGDSVWVAEGTYKPTQTANRDLSFEPKSGVRLFGGFAGAERSFAERRYVDHPTVLSGDIGTPGDSTDNSYNVVYLHFPDTGTVLDGFVVRNGTANSNASVSPTFDRRKCGGGLYIMGADWEAYGEIRNCVFLFNYARNYGGGVLVNGDGEGSVAPRFVNCHFDRNRSFVFGGGAARMGSSFVERGIDFEGCRFTGNVANSWGGGLFFRDAERMDKIEVEGCRFEGNQAGLGGGAARFLMGREMANDLIIKGNYFTKNSTLNKNGELLITDLNEGSVQKVLLDRDTFKFNNLGTPLLISLFGLNGSLELERCNFIENQSLGNGAYLEWYEGASLLVKKCNFEKNFLVGSLLIYFLFNDMKATDCIFSKNTSDKFSIQYINNIQYANCNIFSNAINQKSSAVDMPFGNLHFVNCNVIGTKFKHLFRYFNSADFANSLFTSVPDFIEGLKPWKNTSISHCRFDSLDCAALPPNITCGPNNLIGVPPMFRDSANGDFRLLPCSPLIGAGLNSAAAGILTDLDGKPRFVGGRIDIGPYETPAFAWAAEPLLKPACRDANDGSAELLTANGCPPFGIQWQKDGVAGSGSTGLSSGTYFFEVTDARGQRLRDTLTLPKNPGPVPTASASPVQCGSPAGGSASASATGGVPPVQFLWSNGQTGTDLTGLPPGDYRVTATDAAGCRDSASAQVARLGALGLLVGGKPVSCFGQQDGQLSATPLGGKTPFRYQWSNQATDSLLTGLPPGPYAVTVRDAFGCSAEYAFQLHEPDSLWITGSVQDATGPQTPDGSAAVSGINGGTAPFGYGWTTGASTQSIGGILPGTYTVTVRDFNGCSVEKTLVVKFVSGTDDHEPPALLLLYPNPASESTAIQGTLPVDAKGLQLALYDAQGRLLRQMALPDTAGGGGFAAPVSLSGLAAGTYRAVLRDGMGKVWGVGTLVKI